ncbi:MAG: bacterial Ig-like domain-containing protein, partial [Clostridiales bacterium]|nr:bacterial Ig-like domain-containing protein [Clostridiales bacterium]
ISFMKGDDFTTGDGFTVYAKYDDGRTVDVTDKVEIKPERTFDMNVPGNYQITVSYGGKKTIYTIYVNDAEDVLRKIELDTENVKKEYELGDAISLDGLVLNLTYENAQGVRFDTTTTSLKDFSVDIVGENGTPIADVFTGLGTYTVTVSLGSVKDSFEVNVENINISTVQGAIVVGNFFKSEVASGTQHTKTAMAGGSDVDSLHYIYRFGDNFTYVEETIDQDVIDYRSIDDEGLLNVRFHDGEITSTFAPVTDMMGGAAYFLWYYGDTKYGAEAALLSLYEHAKVCTNKDLKETVDENTRSYSFEFSGLEMGDNSSDYYETKVEFTLGEKYNIEHVKIVQYFYENNSAWEGTKPTFITDDNGITKPNDRFTSKFTITSDQVAGKRTATNPYSRDMFKIKSYDLKYKGEVLDDGAVIKCYANESC